VTHPDGDITDANVAASSMLGFTPEEFLQLNDDLMIAPEVFDSTDAEWQAQLAAKGSFQVETLVGPRRWENHRGRGDQH
jgi:PAS domain-containing protein